MQVDLGWTLTWEGETWSVADLSGEEVGDLVVMIGDNWEALSPTSSPVALLSHIAVHSARVHGVSLEQATADVKAAGIVAMLGALGSLQVPVATGANGSRPGHPPPASAAPAVAFDEEPQAPKPSE